MANNPQFKVSQLAKDLNVKNKEITDMLANKGISVKSTQAVLEPAQFDVLFESLTRENQIDSIEKYMSGITYIPTKEPKVEKKAEPAPKVAAPKAVKIEETEDFKIVVNDEPAAPNAAVEADADQEEKKTGFFGRFFARK